MITEPRDTPRQFRARMTAGDRTFVLLRQEQQVSRPIRGADMVRAMSRGRPVTGRVRETRRSWRVALEKAPRRPLAEITLTDDGRCEIRPLMRRRPRRRFAPTFADALSAIAGCLDPV